MVLARRRTGSQFRYAPSTACAAGLCLVRSFTDKRLHPLSFRSVKELVAQIDAFIAAYNQEAAPFEWTRIKVNAKTFTGKYANLFK